MTGVDTSARPLDRIVFVTVGTTRFDALIDAMDSPEVATALLRRGYTALVMQVGAHARSGSRLLTGARGDKDGGGGEDEARGEGEDEACDEDSDKARDERKATSGVTSDGLHVEWFDYSPSLARYIADAALVVSHAGAGSVFESLAVGVALVVVPNPLLMDDHQAELARKLEGMGVLRSATLSTLGQVLDTANFDGLQPYQPGSSAPMVAALDRLMGFPSQ